ncbi:MAG: helix-turn-helix domain-containing protein [Phyllobacterium sp.]
MNWTQEQLAVMAGVSRSTIKDFECRRHALHEATQILLISAFEQAGVSFLESGRKGPGVRIKRRTSSVN